MTYYVYVTPAGGVGGEFPQPARRSTSKSTCERYADACRAIGQRARVSTQPPGASHHDRTRY